ncbi:DNA-binding SARP family transcriptional activator/predicted ATPase [Streptacidiphilus sp. MAP12-33]|uniref:AfsR/SARP family transcriptional regulator n=1 Tax=Streptacidiphilus sp. MAP12-33 TaxID=3156266 RepID=UPI003513D8C5
MRYFVLGPVRMDPRTPTATKVRALLATLLVRANEVVPITSLVDELWDDEPPRTVITTLQVYVSQLRTQLAAGLPPDEPRDRLLQTRPPGYRLNIADRELDLTVFESLRAAGLDAYEHGDFTDASALFAEALGLWNGVALAGVPHGPLLSAASVRLEELRLGTLERRVAADLRVGRHRELTGELLALTGAHTYREALHAQLMVALYRSGLQSDALAAYARVRKALADELGVDPGPALTRLHERILRSDPTLAWQEPNRSRSSARPAPRPVLWLPAPTEDFTGREKALAAAGPLIGGTAEGEPGVRVLDISGRSGAGKTTLAVELARRHADAFPDGQVLIGLRGSRGRPLDPAQGALALLDHLLGPAERRRRSAAAEHPADVDEVCHRLVEELRGRRLLVILDDATTEEQVRPIVAAAPDAFVLVTSRRRLAGLEGGRHLTLDVLPPAEAQRLLTRIGGDAAGGDPDSVREIARLCGYLPLALRVAGATLVARPHWTAATLAERLRTAPAPLDVLAVGDLDVRSALLVGYQESPGTERRAFRLFALAPASGFALWGAAALLGTGHGAAERVVERLLELRLLEVTGPETAHRYRIHPLLRALAVERLDAEEPESERRAAAGRLAAAYLALATHADRTLLPGRPHQTAARNTPPGPPTGPTRAAPTAPGARAATARGTEPGLTAQTAQAAGPGRPGATGAAAIPTPPAVAAPTARPGGPDAPARAATLGVPATPIAPTVPTPPTVAAPTALTARPGGSTAPGAVARAVPWARIVGDSPVRWFQEETPGALDAARLAHEAEHWPLVWQLAEALTGYLEAAAGWPQWEELCDLALDAAGRAGREDVRAAMLRSLGDLAWQRHRTDEAAHHYQQAAALFRDLADPAGQAGCAVGSADIALSEANPDRAERLLTEATLLHRDADDPRGRADVSRGLALADLLRGRGEDALRRFSEFTDAAELLGDRRWTAFGRRSAERILEHLVDWSSSQRMPAPASVEARPGVWLVYALPA